MHRLSTLKLESPCVCFTNSEEVHVKLFFGGYMFANGLPVCFVSLCEDFGNEQCYKMAFHLEFAAQYRQVDVLSIGHACMGP